ncbi:MAG: nucleoid-associated protein [Gemmatales bacterium]|nr:MAG: nucleoid-associated protein [Gemmatales bacterium]
MFKELGQIASLMRQLPKIKEEMERLQERLGAITAEGDAGGGMVHVKVNGRFEVLACKISDEALADRELLEDLIRAATNQAIERAREKAAEEASKVAGGLGLPAGIEIPGLRLPD